MSKSRRHDPNQEPGDTPSKAIINQRRHQDLIEEGSELDDPTRDPERQNTSEPVTTVTGDDGDHMPQQACVDPPVTSAESQDSPLADTTVALQPSEVQTPATVTLPPTPRPETLSQLIDAWKRKPDEIVTYGDLVELAVRVQSLYPDEQRGQIKGIRTRLDGAFEVIRSLQTRVERVDETLKQVVPDSNESNARLSRALETIGKMVNPQEELQQLREDLATAQSEIKQLRDTIARGGLPTEAQPSVPVPIVPKPEEGWLCQCGTTNRPTAKGCRQCGSRKTA